MAEETTPEGFKRIRFVTRYGVDVRYGFVLFLLEVQDPDTVERHETVSGLEPEQARQLANALHQAANRILPDPSEEPS